MFTSSSSSKVFNIFAHQNPQRSVGLGFLFSKVEQGWECDSAKLLCYSCLKTAVQLVLPYTQLFFSCSSGLLGLWVLAAWVCAAYSCFLSLSLIALPFDSASFVFPFPWIALTIISSYRRHKCFQRCLHLPVLGRGGDLGRHLWHHKALVTTHRGQPPLQAAVQGRRWWVLPTYT